MTLSYMISRADETLYDEHIQTNVCAANFSFIPTGLSLCVQRTVHGTQFERSNTRYSSTSDLSLQTMRTTPLSLSWRWSWRPTGFTGSCIYLRLLITQFNPRRYTSTRRLTSALV